MNRHTTDISPLDPSRKFVRVTGVNGRGFVEFEFSLGGAPDMFVELTLPPAAFEAFCLEQNVARLDDQTNLMTLRSSL